MSQNQNESPNMKKIKTIVTAIAVVVVIILALTGKIPLFNGGGVADETLPVVTADVNAQTQATPGGTTTPAATKTQTEPAQTKAGKTTEAPTEKAYVAYYFRSSKLLNDHYEKHGKEMGFKSAKDYEKAASDVINNPDALTKREKEDNDYVFYVEATNEFVILSVDGYIRTYFLPNGGRSYYDRQ